MTIITNRFLFTINLLTLLLTLTTMGMKKKSPQIQLKEEENTSNIIYKKLSISSVPKTVFYLSSTDTQPYIQITINNRKSDGIICNAIPIEWLYNCNTNSTISIPYKRKLLHMTCVENPELPGKNFQQQYINCMTKFYNVPDFSDTDEQELINAGVITKKTTFIRADTIEWNTEDNTLYLIPPHNEITYGHGPHGCPNEDNLIKRIIAPHIEPYGNSIHNFITTRQSGNTKSLRKLKPCTPKEIPASTPEETDALIQWLKQLNPTKK